MKEPLSKGIRGKSRYMLPNSITALSLVLGLISIAYAFHGNYTTAAWVILFSTILDKLDGTTARFLNASTPFGGQLDSFSDFVAFGIAPSFLVFSIFSADPLISKVVAGEEQPFFVYFSLVFFILASALRLARFNITAVPDAKYMAGLATTVSGGLVSTYVLTCYEYIEYDFFVQMLKSVPYFMLILAVLEVSNVPIEKVGQKKTRAGRWGEAALIVISTLFIVTRSWPEFLFLLAMVYLVIGFVRVFLNRDEVLAEMRRAEREMEENETTESE